jgi:hypothetical protein
VITKIDKNNSNFWKERSNHRGIGGEKLVFVTRVNQYKDMVMLRLSNKNIQVIYEHTKDGFLYEFREGRLYYYDNFHAFHGN